MKRKENERLARKYEKKILIYTMNFFIDILKLKYYYYEFKYFTKLAKIIFKPL